MYKLKQLKNRYFQDLHQKDRKLFFLMAMPRSGNTLFASVMNQNPDIACTANSITLEIMKDLFLLKQTDVFQNFPDHNSLDNVMNSVFDTFYKDWPQKIIIDRGPVMTTGNLELMKKHYNKPFKPLVPLRSVQLRTVHSSPHQLIWGVRCVAQVVRRPWFSRQPVVRP